MCIHLDVWITFWSSKWFWVDLLIYANENWFWKKYVSLQSVYTEGLSFLMGSLHSSFEDTILNSRVGIGNWYWHYVCFLLVGNDTSFKEGVPLGFLWINYYCVRQTLVFMLKISDICINFLNQHWGDNTALSFFMVGAWF